MLLLKCPIRMGHSHNLYTVKAKYHYALQLANQLASWYAS